jgi:hypothetical protein
MRWVVGAAGVGKSVVMQNVAESPELPVNYRASVFFSNNGRNEGTKAFITISYQFAAQCELYRQVIEQAITRDPSLLQLSMAKQFNKLIVEAFIHHPQPKSAGRALVLLTGLMNATTLALSRSSSVSSLISASHTLPRPLYGSLLAALNRTLLPSSLDATSSLHMGRRKFQ